LSHFHFHLNGDEVTEQSTSIGGGVCKYSVVGYGDTVITSASIVQQPSYGVLTQTGAFAFEYRPDAKFRGFDRFTIEVCGHGTSGVEGCSNVNYEETVR
jgi:hypothetical protein